MIGGIILLIGVLLIWIGGTNRGASFWQSTIGKPFKPLGFGSA